MKRCFLAMIFLATIIGCSKLDVADDAILGVWTNSPQQAERLLKMEIDAQEWIFNDLYKGRFHAYKNGDVIYKMDYRWSVEEGNYFLEYNAGPLEAMRFTMHDDVLINKAGNIVASRD